jgi:hypothetical protein
MNCFLRTMRRINGYFIPLTLIISFTKLYLSQLIFLGFVVGVIP